MNAFPFHRQHAPTTSLAETGGEAEALSFTIIYYAR
jgi:hypothetical protein